ncbi:MAG: carboxypeptidase regulatory-like domain-containing protein, partial [Myxococcota bacterium]
MARALFACAISSACICIVIAPPALAQQPAASEREIVRGVLFDEQGVPIAGALVRVGAQLTTTNLYGAYQVEVPPGAYAIYAQPRGEPVVLIDRVTVIAGNGGVELVSEYKKGGEVEVEVEGRQKAEEAPKVSRQEATGDPGFIEGVVVSDTRGAPIRGVRIFIRGEDVEALTGADGTYRLELGPGTYDISFIHPEFSTATEAAVEIVPGRSLELRTKLTPAAFALEDFVVTVPRIEGSTAALLEERQNAATMNEVLGAEQFSKSGDSNAASALKRVTGLTIVGGKFVFIRAHPGRG